MVWNIIQFLFPALLVILPWCLYGRNGKRMARFYWMMAGSETAGKFYVQLLVVFLLANGQLNLGRDWKNVVFPTVILLLLWLDGHQAAKKKEMDRMKSRDL